MKLIWNFQDENMKKSGASQGQSASELISKRIAELGDWRGETLTRMRKLIKEADPDVVEEKKLTSPPSRGSFAKRSPSTVLASRNLRRKRSPNLLTATQDREQAHHQLPRGNHKAGYAYDPGDPERHVV